MGVPIKVKLESVNGYPVKDLNHAVYFNLFENYSMHELLPGNVETG